MSPSAAVPAAAARVLCMQYNNNTLANAMFIVYELNRAAVDGVSGCRDRRTLTEAFRVSITQ